MKKIFTTLAAIAMVAMTAQAEVEVTYNGEKLKNGAEIEVTNKDFKYTNYPQLNWTEWSAEIELEVDGGVPMTAKAEASCATPQFCPNGTCIPFEKAPFSVTAPEVKSTPFSVPIHYNVWEADLPAIDEWMKCTFTDDDGAFVVTIKFKTEAQTGSVNEIAADAEVAAIYDLQGRRVRDDYRGAAIVVYTNGKAAKRLVK